MTPESELRSDFHEQLAEVDGRLSELIHLVRVAIGEATEALLRDDDAAAVAITSRKHLADPLYKEVEDKVGALMAKQGPVASDLQYLLTVLRAVPELEQSAELAATIARRGAQGLVEVLSPRTRAIVTRTGDVVTAMWAELDRRWALHETGTDDPLDGAVEELHDLHTSLTAEVAAGGLPASATMDMALIGRFFERLGDHAVNIVERLDRLTTRPIAPRPASAPEG